MVDQAPWQAFSTATYVRLQQARGSKGGHGQELQRRATAAHLFLLPLLVVLLLHDLVFFPGFLRWFHWMPLGQQGRGVHADLGFVHAAAQRVHQEPKVLGQYRREAALHCHAELPTNTPHMQAAVPCGSRNNMSIRVRSGGRA